MRNLAGSALLCLVIACSFARPADAATAGSYKCLGRADGVTFFFEVVHHNPNASTQNIKRIRGYDPTGALVIDTGVVTIPVAGHATFPFFLTDLPFIAPADSGDFVLIVNWAQGNDVAPPISRANHYFVSGSGDVSMSHATCP